jgi:chemotaxis protein CheZ
LSDLSKITEDGTLEVMRLTEMMQDNHGQIAKDLSAVVEVLRAMDCVTLAGRLGNLTSVLAQDDKYLTEIMTALSFQDLVAQRVKKLVVILDEVQRRLMELIVVFGLQQNGEHAADVGTAGDLLKQLEESNTTAMKQKVADDILAQFGFK